MEVVFENLDWMRVNVALALLGVVFGWLFYNLSVAKISSFAYNSRKLILCVIFFTLWVLFIPNTIYLITDLQHLPKQLVEANLLTQIILIVEYGVLVLIGIVTFIISMHPVEKIFDELHFKRRKNLKFAILLLVNFFIAFALILGKYQRTHSWYVFTDFYRFITDITIVFNTPILLIMVFFFGIAINLTYFGFKNIIR